jgi:hypothetical protein
MDHLRLAVIWYVLAIFPFCAFFGYHTHTSIWRQMKTPQAISTLARGPIPAYLPFFCLGVTLLLYHAIGEKRKMPGAWERPRSRSHSQPASTEDPASPKPLRGAVSRNAFVPSRLRVRRKGKKRGLFCCAPVASPGGSCYD